VDVEHITVGVLQVLASYVSLYSTIIRSLKQFTSDLFRAFGGLTNAKRRLVSLSEDARRASHPCLASELGPA
jgi:hypothetical protein